MNKSILKILLMIALLAAIIFQVTFILKNKSEVKTFKVDSNISHKVEEIKYPSLEEYINKLNGYGDFNLVSIHTIDDYYEVSGEIVGDPDIIINFFIYLDDVIGYNITDYLIRSSDGQYQLDVVLELPR